MSFGSREKPKDSIESRMKEQYEDRYKFMLPRRTYTIIRIDGKAFHSFTRNFKRPFDENFAKTMDTTAIRLCEEIQGSNFAFVQSDEISLLMTDFETIHTDAWFNGNLQKIVSVAASTATAAFNAAIREQTHEQFLPQATFDARAFVIPDKEEVLNYFVWRQQDATRNSIQAVAQSLYSQKELHGKNNSQLQEMIFQKGVNWNDYKPRYKRGGAIIKLPSPSGCEQGSQSRWEVDTETPIFTQVREYLADRTPHHGYEKELLASVVSPVGPTYL